MAYDLPIILSIGALTVSTHARQGCRHDHPRHRELPLRGVLLLPCENWRPLRSNAVLGLPTRAFSAGVLRNAGTINFVIASFFCVCAREAGYGDLPLHRFEWRP